MIRYSGRKLVMSHEGNLIDVVVGTPIDPLEPTSDITVVVERRIFDPHAETVDIKRPRVAFDNGYINLKEWEN